MSALVDEPPAMKKVRSKEPLKLAQAQEHVKKEKSREKTVKPERDKRWKREKPLDREIALYAARADRGAKKGQARRKNYFQALDQYQTTVAGGGTTIGGATAIHDREDDDFAAKTTQEMIRFLNDEKLVETKYEFAGGWERFLLKMKRNPMKSAIYEYCRMEEAIGQDMMNVLSKTTNVDGSTELKYKDLPSSKPPPLKRVDDPAYELQWM
ncbi:unnamed protein product [Strongylus vulgaris]|uniref:Uncharacterized protein n=1 Tax=Strongylus vulgaris TaxID=40348 RepID=A0A3P7IA25_STRVU|nr:unnamed protein product [Strongylus vulgaris]